MKRKSWTNLWLFFYLNFWYIPLLAFLLGVKISLISLLVQNALENHNRYDSPGGSWKETRHEKILTKTITKIIEDNMKQNQLNHRYSNRGEKSERNESFSLKNKDELDWAAKLRQSNQPLHVEDWNILEHLEQSQILPTHENRTNKDSIWLILNKVPLGGGDIISKLLEDLEEENNFKHLLHEYRTPWPRFLLAEEQQSLVTWFEYQHLPRSYDRHFYFVNFTKFQKYVFENPIYINMVCEPSSRLKASFQWKRRDQEKSRREVQRLDKIIPGSGERWLKKNFEDCVIKADPECSFENGTQDFTMTVPFFCGQFNSCVTLNNRWAVQSAKFNIEKYYSVVGVLEKLQESLTLLQNYIPRFFTGIDNLESKGEIEVKEMSKYSHVSIKVKKILQDKLPGEYDLYNFILSRLDKQMNFIRNKKNHMK